MEANVIDNFGELFRKLRTRRKHTDEQLATIVGRHRYYFRKWETQRVSINRRGLLKVCKILEVSEADRKALLTLADERLMVMER